MTTQQPPKESLCRSLITLWLNQDAEHITILIDCTPQILKFAVDSEEDLIQIPAVPQAVPLVASISEHTQVRTLAPLPHAPIRDDDSALRKKILNIPEEAKAMIGPDRIADDFAGKAIAGVRRPMSLHEISVPPTALKLTKPFERFANPSETDFRGSSGI